MIRSSKSPWIPTLVLKVIYFFSGNSFLNKVEWKTVVSVYFLISVFVQKRGKTRVSDTFSRTRHHEIEKIVGWKLQDHKFFMGGKAVHWCKCVPGGFPPPPKPGQLIGWKLLLIGHCPRGLNTRALSCPLSSLGDKMSLNFKSRDVR